MIEAQRVPIGHVLCHHHGRVVPRGAAGCWLCEGHDAESDRLSLLCRVGLGDVPQYRITAAMLRRALRSARTIERCVAEGLGMVEECR